MVPASSPPFLFQYLHSRSNIKNPNSMVQIQTSTGSITSCFVNSQIFWKLSLNQLKYWHQIRTITTSELISTIYFENKEIFILFTNLTHCTSTFLFGEGELVVSKMIPKLDFGRC